MVAGIDVERARDSFIGRKIMEQMDSKDADFAKFVTATGFDPRRDLKEIVIATPDTNTKNPPALFLVRGTFDMARINGFLKSSGVAAAETLGGVEFYTQANGKEDMGFAFLDSSLAVGGPKEVVRAALKRRAGSGAALTAATLAKVQSMSQSNDIWAVTSIPVAELSNALPGGEKGPSGMMNGDAFKAIEQAAMGLRFGAEFLEFTAETISKTEKDATAIADVVRFLSTMVQMNREKPEVKAFATALDGMKLSTEARTTKLSISLPMAEMEQMIKSNGKPAPKKI